MLEKNVLIQQINAVESLSNVDVLCLDKTGTLTTNQLHLQSVHSVGMREGELRKILGTYAASTSSVNKTIEAIMSACSGQKLQPIFEIPFSSVRGWSALAFESNRESELRQGIYILGAPERLTPVLDLSVETTDLIGTAAEKGSRVVLLTYHANLEALPNERNSFRLPSNLTLVGILVFGDHLRPQAREILLNFIKAGIEVKIISGDSPKTVAALARQLGLNSDIKVTSGLELARMDDEEFIQTARMSQIFGRITPEQKAKLIQSFRQHGSYVAMIGDGVNDVLSLKQANLAIAMESGSQSTRSVADLVLLKDSFAALPHIFLEGQRIRNSIHDMMKLFMVRTLCITLLILTTAIVTGTFPLANKQSALIALIGVGIPTFVIPAWARSGQRSQSNLVRSILHFVVPATLTLALVSFIVYLLYLMVAFFHLPFSLELRQVDYKIPQSALVTILILGELLLLPFLKPPTSSWVGGEPLSGDWRYSILALLLLALYGVILLAPPLYQFFELAQLSTISYLFIGLVALVWCFLLRWLWRFRLLDRLLGVDLNF